MYWVLCSSLLASQLLTERMAWLKPWSSKNLNNVEGRVAKVVWPSVRAYYKRNLIWFWKHDRSLEVCGSSGSHGHSEKRWISLALTYILIHQLSCLAAPDTTISWLTTCSTVSEVTKWNPTVFPETWFATWTWHLVWSSAQRAAVELI